LGTNEIGKNLVHFLVDFQLFDPFFLVGKLRAIRVQGFDFCGNIVILSIELNRAYFHGNIFKKKVRKYIKNLILI